MEKDLDEKVTINEFINMWVDAEYKLMEKKKACEEDIADAMMRKGKLRKIIAEYEDEETIQPSSSLQVYIFEAINVEVDNSMI